MTDKEPTSRQRSAFSDAVEITNELTRLGIPPEKMIEAMQHSLEEYLSAAEYAYAVYFAKWNKKEGTEND